ncbi:MAG TPA: VWA domain-containing protein [Mycobacteriales bacterium]|nr:VWA domain-containing protein [Mycobacteriales bacterium]
MSGLVDRTVEMVAAMRAAGIPVSLAEDIDAVRALAAVPLLDRAALRAGLAATTVKRPAHRPAFDTLFDLYFPPAVGAGVWAELADADGAAEDAAEAGTEYGGSPADGELARERLRAELYQVLLDGDDEALRRLARASVLTLGRVDTQPGRQGYFSYRVLRALAPETLMAGLLQAMLTPDQRGGLAEQVARRTVSDRMKRFEELVEAEVRRLLAEEAGVAKVARTAVRTLPADVDFVRATAADIAELRRTVLPLARRLAVRLAARRRRGRRGRLDFRRTVRSSLSTGGVPVVTHHRPHKPHRPELVILCDVSGSVSAFARFTLMLAYTLREQFAKVRAFAFVDTCDEVTEFFAGDDFGEAMRRLTDEAQLVWFDGHSDYGHSIEVFAERYPDAVGPRTSLLILGDARNNYRATGGATLRRLANASRHTYWLNPEPRTYWGSGDSAVRDYEPLVDEMVECRNAAQLEEWMRTLLR